MHTGKTAVCIKDSTINETGNEEADDKDEVCPRGVNVLAQALLQPSPTAPCFVVVGHSLDLAIGLGSVPVFVGCVRHGAVSLAAVVVLGLHAEASEIYVCI